MENDRKSPKPLNHDDAPPKDNHGAEPVWQRAVDSMRALWETRRFRDTSGRPSKGPTRYHFLNRFKRQGRQKVYVLKGYTTRARITNRWKRERRIKRNIYIAVAILYIIFLFVLFYAIDPIGRLTELQRMLGF